MGRVPWEPQQPLASGVGENIRSQTVAPGCWLVIKSGVQREGVQYPTVGCDCVG